MRNFFNWRTGLVRASPEALTIVFSGGFILLTHHYFPVTTIVKERKDGIKFIILIWSLLNYNLLKISLSKFINVLCHILTFIF